MSNLLRLIVLVILTPIVLVFCLVEWVFYLFTNRSSVLLTKLQRYLEKPYD